MDAQANSNKLDDDQIQSIVKLGLELEKAYKSPQDIEWAYQDGEFFIIQTRPITTLTDSNGSTPGLEVDENTNFLLSIADRDKEDSLDFIKKLKSNGNKIYATEGTFNFLKSKGFDAIKVNKILSQSPTVIDLINQGKVGAVLNTVTGNRTAIQDGYHIRRKATEFSIPCYTSIDTSYATIMNTSKKSLNVSTFDDYLK